MICLIQLSILAFFCSIFALSSCESFEEWQSSCQTMITDLQQELIVRDDHFLPITKMTAQTFLDKMTKLYEKTEAQGYTQFLRKLKRKLINIMNNCKELQKGSSDQRENNISTKRWTSLNAKEQSENDSTSLRDNPFLRALQLGTMSNKSEELDIIRKQTLLNEQYMENLMIRIQIAVGGLERDFETVIIEIQLKRIEEEEWAETKTQAFICEQLDNLANWVKGTRSAYCAIGPIDYARAKLIYNTDQKTLQHILQRLIVEAKLSILENEFDAKLDMVSNPWCIDADEFIRYEREFKLSWRQLLLKVDTLPENKEDKEHFHNRLHALTIKALTFTEPLKHTIREKLMEIFITTQKSLEGFKNEFYEGKFELHLLKQHVQRVYGNLLTHLHIEVGMKGTNSFEQTKRSAEQSDDGLKTLPENNATDIVFGELDNIQSRIEREFEQVSNAFIFQTSESGEGTHMENEELEKWHLSCLQKIKSLKHSVLKGAKEQNIYNKLEKKLWGLYENIQKFPSRNLKYASCLRKVISQLIIAISHCMEVQSINQKNDAAFSETTKFLSQNDKEDYIENLMIRIQTAAGGLERDFDIATIEIQLKRIEEEEWAETKTQAFICEQLDNLANWKGTRSAYCAIGPIDYARAKLIYNTDQKTLQHILQRLIVEAKLSILENEFDAKLDMVSNPWCIDADEFIRYEREFKLSWRQLLLKVDTWPKYEEMSNSKRVFKKKTSLIRTKELPVKEILQKKLRQLFIKTITAAQPFKQMVEAKLLEMLDTARRALNEALKEEAVANAGLPANDGGIEQAAKLLTMKNERTKAIYAKLLMRMQTELGMKNAKLTQLLNSAADEQQAAENDANDVFASVEQSIGEQVDGLVDAFEQKAFIMNEQDESENE